MAARKPLVIINGQVQQLSSSDTLDAAVSEVDIVQKMNANASTIDICSPVYVKTSGDIDLARANASTTRRVLGLVKDAAGIATSAAGSIQTDGVMTATTGQWDAVTGETGGLTEGAVYYLSAATAGKLTTTAPSTATQYVVPVGLALSTTEMDISTTLSDVLL